MIELYEDEAGEHRWRLRAANGEIVATGEGYTRPEDAARGFKAARRAMALSLDDDCPLCGRDAMAEHDEGCVLSEDLA